MRITRKKKFFVAGVAALGLVGGGSAIAFWTTTGSGSGTAATGTTAAIVVNQTPFAAALYPDGSPVTLSGTFDSNNTGLVSITSVTALIPVAWSAQANASKPACTAADFVIAGNTGVPRIVVPVGSGVGSWTGLTIQLINTTTNQDNCKSLTTVPINYTVVP